MGQRADHARLDVEGEHGRLEGDLPRGFPFGRCDPTEFLAQSGGAQVKRLAPVPSKKRCSIFAFPEPNWWMTTAGACARPCG